MRLANQYPTMNRHHSGIFSFHFEPISNFVLVFLFLTLNQLIFAGLLEKEDNIKQTESYCD